MEKISPRLKEKINAAGPDKEQSLNLIITLTENSVWEEEIRLLKEADFQICSTMEEIRVVSGKARPSVIQNIAKLPAVKIIEFDEQASINEASMP